ncbi:SusC/RagA family TonB-linked outer membrane protein [Bacteroides ovatus]|nr:SusC/RagA family TonB-linked outer membrane protein [Bacteroides ovatus]
MLKNKATKQTHSFSIAGGTEHIRTKATFGYDYADGLYNNRDYERFTVRMNNDIKINKYISAAFDISVKRSSYTKPTYDPMDASNLFPQVYAATWSDGRIADGKSGDNPYAKLHYGGNKKEYYNQVSGKIALYLTPVKGLKLSAVLSPIYNDSRTKEFRKRIEYFSAENPNELIGAITDYGSTQLSESRGNKQSITKQLFANYDCTLGNHTLTLLLGYEDNTYKTEDLKASRDHFELTQYPYLDRGSSDYQFNNGNAKHTAYRSTFGRIMYNYNNRYLLQANLRSDSSSRFDKKHRIGYFPSISGGWVISEEPFFKDLHIKPLSFLKFRASYGLLGNDRVGEYPYLPLLAYSDQLFYEGNNVTSYLTAAQWQYAIRNISWETTKTFGLGLDVALLDGRLRLTADYYYKITKDMILDVDIPDYVGYDNPQQNTGKMKTTGFEIEMSWNDHINDFHYGISANLSDYRSKMGYLGGNQFLGDRIKRMGSYFNEWYGYRTDGIFQTSEEIANTPVMNNNVKPGDIKYLKADPTDNSPISPDRDRVLLGNSQPRFLYGATLNADYKGFDLNISMQGIGKQLQCKKTEMVQPLRNNFGAIPRLIDGKYWSNYNTPEQNAEAKYPRLTSTQSVHNYAMSDFWLFNGAYFRLKNITVGYTVPKHLTEKLSIKSLRIYLSANDILCFSKYPKGWDPENSSDVIGGTDNKDFYPITRSILGGINIKF